MSAAAKRLVEPPHPWAASSKPFAAGIGLPAGPGRRTIGGVRVAPAPAPAGLGAGGGGRRPNAARTAALDFSGPPRR